MAKSFKKVMSLILLGAFLLSFSGASAEEAVSEDKAIFNVKGIGLMQGYEDGSFREDKDLTRAEMTVIVGRILQVMEDTRCDTVFPDVTAEHWASGVIAALSDMGIVKGMGDGTFQPDKSVTFNQTIKLIVAALGYGDIAEGLGGYPAGYVTEAANLRLLKGVDSQERIISRGDTAKILYNAFDVKPMSASYNKEQHVSDKTLYETLTDEREVKKYHGILSETGNYSLISAEPAEKDGYILLDCGENDRKRLPCSFNMDVYLGCDINVYVYMEDGEPREIKNVSLTNLNEIYEYDAENVRWENGYAKIEKDDKKEETKRLSNTVKVLFNGRLSDFSSIKYGSYKFLDNNGDRAADVLFINEAESFIVDRINAEKNTVYCKNDFSSTGMQAFMFDEEDEKKTVVLSDKEGNPIKVGDIKENSGITVFKSKDSKCIRAIVCEDVVSGVIKEITGDELWIDGAKYKLAKTGGSASFSPGLGDEGTYALDFYGNIICAYDVVKGDYLYAYVISAGRDQDGISDEVQLKTITGLKPQKEVVKSGDDEDIYYYFRNDFVKVYELAEKVKYYYVDSEGNRENIESMEPEELEECVIAFKLNSEGKIKEINEHNVSESNTNYLLHAFNGKALTFGGDGLFRGWATDNNTVFIYLPESENKELETEDYYVQHKIKHDKNEKIHKVYGQVFFHEPGYEYQYAEPVDVLIIKSEIDSSEPAPTDDVCIVGSVNQSIGTIYDDAGLTVYNIEMLKGSQVIKLPTASSGKSYDIAKRLHKGDLIRYVTDGFGRIAGITVICSTQGLAENYTSSIITGSPSESGKYGLIHEINYDIYDVTENDYVDRFKLSYVSDVGESDLSEWLCIPKTDGPPVYLYDRQTGWIKPGDLSDVTQSRYAGSEASKAVVLKSEVTTGEIVAVVIIEN